MSCGKIMTRKTFKLYRDYCILIGLDVNYIMLLGGHPAYKLLEYSSLWPREPNTLQLRRTHANREKLENWENVAITQNTKRDGWQQI